MERHDTLAAPVLLHGAVSLLIVLSVLAGYHNKVVRTTQLVGVVDLAEVYRNKEAEFTRLLTQARTEPDRERALAMARDFSERLPEALEELPRDCSCLVVLKSAVAGHPPSSVDLTRLLRSKVAPRHQAQEGPP